MTEPRHVTSAWELARFQALAKRGHALTPWQTLGLINTIHSLSRRLQVRFNETVQARQDAAAARERAESAERQLAARGPMADLGHLADAVARAESAEQEVARLISANRDLYQQVTDVSATAWRERELTKRERQRAERAERDRREAIERAEREVSQARMIAHVHGEAGIRERFGIKPDEDLYDGLSRRVGELQTSEAELVSRPLKKQVAELEARNQKLVDEMARHNREKDSRIAELEQSVQARNQLLDSSSRAKRKVHELVWAKGVDRAMEDLPPYLGDESDQLSAEQVAGGYLVQVIREVREALSDKDTPPQAGMTARVHGQTWTTVGGRQVQIGSGPGYSAYSATNSGKTDDESSPAPETPQYADDCLRTYGEVLERSGDICNICAYPAERHHRSLDPDPDDC